MTTLMRGLLVAAALLQAGAGTAQTYPGRPVRLIVPFAPGGPTDVIGRIVAQKLSESFGQQVYVEDVPGAGGNIGTAMVAKARPDGYTMLVLSTGFMVNPSLYGQVPYDPIKDFAPITLVATSPNVLSVNPQLPAHSVKELIELVKASPGTLSFAQPGTGSTPHLAGELFKLTFHLDLVMVPFNGAAPAINSTLGGHTPILFTALPPALGNIREGKLRALAVLSPMRAAALPDVPSMAEAGVPDQESDTLTGLAAPAGTPADIVARWQAEVARALALPDVKQRLDDLGFAPVGDTPSHFGERIKDEIAKWGKVVHDARLRAE